MMYTFLVCFFGLGAITAISFIVISIRDKELFLFVVWILIFAFMTICMIESRELIDIL